MQAEFAPDRHFAQWGHDRVFLPRYGKGDPIVLLAQENILPGTIGDAHCDLHVLAGQQLLLSEVQFRRHPIDLGLGQWKKAAGKRPQHSNPFHGAQCIPLRLPLASDKAGPTPHCRINLCPVFLPPGAMLCLKRFAGSDQSDQPLWMDMRRIGGEWKSDSAEYHRNGGSH